MWGYPVQRNKKLARTSRSPGSCLLQDTVQRRSGVRAGPPALAIWRGAQNALALPIMAERKGLDAFEGCALPAALETMGERWSFMILRACFSGIVYFEDFQSALGIARNILSNRLGKLVAKGILTREPVANDKRRVAYRLTAKGKALVPVMIALRQWGERWEDVPPARRLLADNRDLQPVRQICLQSADGRLLDYDDLCWIEAEDASSDEPGCASAPGHAIGLAR